MIEKVVEVGYLLKTNKFKGISCNYICVWIDRFRKNVHDGRILILSKEKWATCSYN